MSSIARGSHDSLAEVYSRHGSSVQRLAQRLCGQDRAADVTQDVFLGLWHRPERFDQERGSLRAFLLVQTRGRAVDLLRSDTARRARETTSLHRDRAAAAQVDEMALARMAGTEAWLHLSRLGEAERLAITLAYFGGHTYREVADLLGLPEGTVKSRIRTGLRRLRSGLSAEAPDASSPEPRRALSTASHRSSG